MGIQRQPANFRTAGASSPALSQSPDKPLRLLPHLLPDPASQLFRSRVPSLTAAGSVASGFTVKGVCLPPPGAQVPSTPPPLSSSFPQSLNTALSAKFRKNALSFLVLSTPRSRLTWRCTVGSHDAARTPLRRAGWASRLGGPTL